MKRSRGQYGGCNYTISDDPMTTDSYTISTTARTACAVLSFHSPLSKPVNIGRELAARMLRQARKRK